MQMFMIKASANGWIAITDGFSHITDNMQKAKVYKSQASARHARIRHLKAWPDATIVAVKLVYVEAWA